MDFHRGIYLIVLQILSIGFTYGKVYERCELARELKDRHRIPEGELATWVCIARHESEFNTSAVGRLNGDGSEDHGIFQISDKYWCSPPGEGYGCAKSCSSFEDDDIADDIKCVRRIKRAHDRMTSGNGFSAWAVYGHHCSGTKEFMENKFTADCFNGKKEVKNETSSKNKLVLIAPIVWPYHYHIVPKYPTAYWHVSTPINYHYQQNVVG